MSGLKFIIGDDNVSDDFGNLGALYSSNSEKETAGVWVFPAGEGDGSPAFKIARAGGANKAFEVEQMKALRPYQKLIQANSKKPSAEVMDLIKKTTKDTFIKTCLLDWRNVKNSKGETVPFSKEKAKAMLEQLPELYEELLGQSQALATFQDDEIEADAGN